MTEGTLSAHEIRDIVATPLDELAIEPEDVLVIHPDYTRRDYTDILFPQLVSLLQERGTGRVDTLNAAGTHAEMTQEALREKLGISDASEFGVVGELFNHHYYDDSELRMVGTIPAEFVAEQTQGKLEERMNVTANRRLFGGEYDLIVAISATSPHEAAGYAGGLKAFFPGVSGPEVIGLLHWAAVLVGIPDIIGKVDNPARRVINWGSELICDEATKMGCSELLSLDMVLDEDETTHEILPKGLYTGVGLEGFKQAYVEAAEACDRYYVVEIEEPFDIAAQMIGEQYDEIWTAGKGSYKLQPRGVMAGGGEIILYAPHIHRFHSSETMDRAIRAIGYRTREDALQWLAENPWFEEEFAADWQNVASHIINVNGDDTFEVTLATGMPQAECEEAGLNYLAPDDLEDYLETKRQQGKRAGKIADGGKKLYRMRGRG